MKTLKSFSAALFAAAFLGASLPQSSRAVFYVDWTEYNKGHSFVGFKDDQNDSVFAAWLLNKGVPTATLWFAEGGDYYTGWYIRDVCVHHDGSITIMWYHNDTNQLAFWIISSSGVLISAATYSFDEGNPWYFWWDLDCLCNYSLCGFGYQDPFTQVSRHAWWLLGPGGNVEKTFLFADDGPWWTNAGWYFWTFWVDDPRGFAVEFYYDNGSSKAYAIWRFDTNGEWIGASTLAY